MSRVIVLVGVIVLVALAASWLSGNPGNVTIEWLGWRADTSVTMLAFLVALLTVLGAIGYRMWRAVLLAPGRFFQARRMRRRRRGYQALSSGMIAAAAGDTAEAQRQARKAENLLEDASVTRLLRAEAAKLNGDASTARRTYEEMADNPETALIGLRGLLDQADERGDRAEALRLAEKAHRQHPKAQGIVRRLLDLQVEFGQWDAADRTLSEAVRYKTFPPSEAKRWRAAVLLERSRTADRDGEAAEALALAKQAHQLDGARVPVAVQFAGLLHAQGKTKRAQKVLEKIWQLQPHPDIADAYGALFASDTDLARVKRYQRLLSFRPDHAEGHLALAQAALAAQLWGEARAHLGQASERGVTPRVCRMMAELEEAEHEDGAAARGWLERATTAEPDPAWVCDNCGAAAGEWTARCGNCNTFDTLAWHPPLHTPRLTQDAPAPALPASD